MCVSFLTTSSGRLSSCSRQQALPQFIVQGNKNTKRGFSSSQPPPPYLPIVGTVRQPRVLNCSSKGQNCQGSKMKGNYLISQVSLVMSMDSMYLIDLINLDFIIKDGINLIQVMSKKHNSKIRTEAKSQKEIIETITRMWETYIKNESTSEEQQKEMNRLKHKVNQLRQKYKPNVNQQLTRREQDNLKVLKKQLETLKNERDILSKLQNGNPSSQSHQIHTENIAMKQSAGTIQRIRNLKQENKLLFDELREKQKKSIKEHTEMYKKIRQERSNSSEGEREQVKTNITNLNKEIEEIYNLKSEAQGELKKQLQQVDLSYNKIKSLVGKKKQIYEQKMKQLQKLKAKAQQQDRIKASIEKQKERQRIRSKLNEKRKSLSSKRSNEENEKNKDKYRQYLNGQSGHAKTGEADYLNSVPDINERQLQSRQVIQQLGRISKVVKGKQNKIYNSIGIGTTFYYEDN